VLLKVGLMFLSALSLSKQSAPALVCVNTCTQMRQLRKSGYSAFAPLLFTGP